MLEEKDDKVMKEIVEQAFQDPVTESPSQVGWNALIPNILRLNYI